MDSSVYHDPENNKLITKKKHTKEKVKEKNKEKDEEEGDEEIDNYPYRNSILNIKLLKTKSKEEKSLKKETFFFKINNDKFTENNKISEVKNFEPKRKNFLIVKNLQKKGSSSLINSNKKINEKNLDLKHKAAKNLKSDLENSFNKKININVNSNKILPSKNKLCPKYLEQKGYYYTVSYNSSDECNNKGRSSLKKNDSILSKKSEKSNKSIKSNKSNNLFESNKNNILLKDDINSILNNSQNKLKNKSISNNLFVKEKEKEKIFNSNISPNIKTNIDTKTNINTNTKFKFNKAKKIISTKSYNFDNIDSNMGMDKDEEKNKDKIHDLVINYCDNSKYSSNNSPNRTNEKLNQLELKLKVYYQNRIKRDTKINNRNNTNSNEINFEDFIFYDNIIKENNEEFNIINNLLEEIGNIYKIENSLFKDLIKELNSIYNKNQIYFKEVIEKNKYIQLCKGKNYIKFFQIISSIMK